MNFKEIFNKYNLFNNITYEDQMLQKRKSIYQTIVDNTKSLGKIIDFTLPDDDTINEKFKINLAPGAKDNLFQPYRNISMVKQISNLLKDITLTNNSNAKLEYYTLIKNGFPFNSFSDLINQFIDDEIELNENFYNWQEYLLFNTPDREVLKLTIAILGTIRTTAYEKHFEILAKHDEFTLYCAIAIRNNYPDYEYVLWNLAQTVYGWGRINLVDQLCDTKDEKLKYWMLTEGYKNEVEYGYLAYQAATVGELNHELHKSDVHSEILLAASEIIRGLITDINQKGISIYQETKDTLQLFIDKTKKTRDNLNYFLTYDAIYHYLKEQDFTSSSLTCNGLDEAFTNRIMHELANEFTLDNWRLLFNEQLIKNNSQDFYLLNQVGIILKEDLYDFCFNKLQADKFNVVAWSNIIRYLNQDRVIKLIDFAEVNLSFPKVNKGINNQLAYQKHVILYNILSALKDYPTYGQKFIIMGINNQMDYNRQATIDCLNSWGCQNISEELRNTIIEAEKNELNYHIKQLYIELIAKFKEE